MSVMSLKQMMQRKVLLNKESKEYKHGDPYAENPTED